MAFSLWVFKKRFFAHASFCQYFFKGICQALRFCSSARKKRIKTINVYSHGGHCERFYFVTATICRKRNKIGTKQHKSVLKNKNTNFPTSLPPKSVRRGEKRRKVRFLALQKGRKLLIDHSSEKLTWLNPPWYSRPFWKRNSRKNKILKNYTEPKSTNPYVQKPFRKARERPLPRAANKPLNVI
jgi:hypothetical protein